MNPTESPKSFPLHDKSFFTVRISITALCLLLPITCNHCFIIVHNSGPLDVTLFCYIGMFCLIAQVLPSLADVKGLDLAVGGTVNTAVTEDNYVLVMLLSRNVIFQRL